MTKKEIIDSRYELVAELECDGKKGSVFKAVTMFDLPKSLIEDYAKPAIRHQYKSVNGWWNHNPDYGEWDAFTIEHKTEGSLDIYVCAIIVRPFSEEAGRVYENTLTFSPIDRLKLTFDSRVYDLIHNNKNQ